MDKSEKTILLIVIGVVAGCLLIAMLCAAIFLMSEKLSPTVPTPALPTATVCSVTVKETKTITSIDDQQLLSADETKATLEKTTIPTADLNVIADWRSGTPNIPIQLEAAPIPYQINDRLQFYKIDENNVNVLTHATLRYATETIYFWAEEDIILEQGDLALLVEIFSTEIYPTTQAFFGAEWIPGVDNDPHLFILYARGIGSTVAGYTSSIDYVLPQAYEYSNAREMFVINADEQSISDLYTLSTMAHELQHVILGYRDKNEDLWLNEGFSELSTLINGYDAGGFDYWFSRQPDMQLNNWQEDADLQDINYGASFLFTSYFYGRFGESMTKAWISDPLNGFESIDSVFRTNNITDPQTGSLFTAEEFFRDWTLANFLNDVDFEDGRYYYSAYPSVPTVNDSEWLNECDGSIRTETVNQFGTDYYQIGCSNPVQVTITGMPTAEVFSDKGENTTYVMWSNRGDSSVMTLTREFDFTNWSGPITLSYDLWYDLETDFDYVYLLASVDGGTWRMLDTGTCSEYSPTLGDYICAYTGQTDGWQSHVFDLSHFSGKKVQLRFEYVSDGGISKEGFAIDNISIPEIGYEETFEARDGEWIKEGFVRIRNQVPQTYLVSLITSDAANPIKKYQINAGEELNLVINPDCLDFQPSLVISATSRFARQLAEYSIILAE